MQLIRLNQHTIGHSLGVKGHFLLPPCVITIGNFDGVHLGHQALIQRLLSYSKQHKLVSAVMLFEPQPLECITSTSAPGRINSWVEKAAKIADLGVDYIVLVEFDTVIQSLSADAFCGLLHRTLQVQHAMVGDDFRFGKGRSGNADLLRSHHISVGELPTLMVDHQRVSSTRIRGCLQAGDFASASALLGNSYRITGTVQYGNQIGRTLQFPTANIRLNRPQPCLHGIYAVNVYGANILSRQVMTNILSNKQHPAIAGTQPLSVFGAAHVGTRPAIKQTQPEWRLEVFLPQVNAQLYGLKLTVEFMYWLHGERNYPSLSDLQQGIKADVTELLHWRTQQGK